MLSRQCEGAGVSGPSHQGAPKSGFTVVACSAAEMDFPHRESSQRGQHPSQKYQTQALAHCLWSTCPESTPLQCTRTKINCLKGGEGHTTPGMVHRVIPGSACMGGQD